MLGLWGGEPTDGPFRPHPAYGNVGQLCGRVVRVAAVHAPPAAFVEAALSGVVRILIVVVVGHVVPVLAVSQLPARAVRAALAVDRESVVHVSQLETRAVVG